MVGDDIVSIRLVFGNGGAELARGVRSAVFIEEQGVPVAMEWDGLDHMCVHALAEDGADRVIGTGRLMPDGRIGRMAVLAHWRGRGIGGRLLEALLCEHRVRSWPPAHLHAQLEATEFYARHGFEPNGDPFVEVGIPHVLMRLEGGSVRQV